MDGGEVCLLDCGQVKQLTTSERLGLASLIILVNEWEKESKRQKELGVEDTEGKLKTATKLLADKVRSFGTSYRTDLGCIQILMIRVSF